MAVLHTNDTTTGDPVAIVTGVVEFIKFDEIKGVDKFGNTHRASLKIGEDWVNQISIKTNEGYDPAVRINNGNRTAPDWQNVSVGDEVRIVATPNEYNGKTYLNASVSKIKITNKGSGAPSTAKSGGGQTSGGQKTQSVSQTVGVSAGNSRTSAVGFLKGKVASTEKIQELIKWFAEYTHAKKAEYAKANPKLSDYEVGMTVGQAVKEAATLAKTLEDVDKIVDNYLTELVPYSTIGMKNLIEGKSFDGEALEKEVKGSSLADNLADMDDDIPFN